MAPLALAPALLVPFAEAIGIVTAGLSLAALSDLVSDYMEDNPEKSEMILGMLSPAEGLFSGGFNALFNKKSKGGEEEISLEEIKTKPKSKRSKKEVVLEALRKKKGNYASPDAEGNYASPGGRVIRGLADEGHIPDKPDPNYDPAKKYKGYKKFFNKAEGGMAGTKTYHQYHDQYVPMDEESMMYANGGGVGSMMQPRQNYALAGFIEDESETFTPNNFGLQLGKNNVDNTQVAEAFNYNTLPQATESFTPESTMTTSAKVDSFMKKNPNLTKGDFVNALQDGTLGVGGSILFDKNVDSLFKGVNLNKNNSIFNVEPTFKGTSDGTFRGTLDIDKNALEKEALDSLPQGFFNDEASLNNLLNNRYVNANTTMTDGNYITKKNNYVSPTMNMKQNEMNQINTALPKDGIFNSLINNVMDSKPMRGLTSAYNLASDNVIGPLFAGIAGIANRYNPLREGSQNYNPNLQGQVDMLNERGMLGDQSSPYKITSGPLAGKNLVSGFGTNDYGQMLQKRIDYFRGFKNLTDSQNAKLHATIAAKKAADKIAADKAAASNNRGGDGRYGRGSDGQKSYDTGLGFGANATTGGPVSNRTGRGRTDYSQGGLVTLRNNNEY